MAHSFMSLTSMTPAELEGVLSQGKTPQPSKILGWEFRGWNVFGDASAKLVGSVMGIQRFAKGFFVRGKPGVPEEAKTWYAQTAPTLLPDFTPTFEGYNVKIRRGTRDEPWTGIPDDDHLTRHSFYKVYGPGQGANRAGRYPQALFLDYSEGVPANNLFTGSTIKDFVVVVDEGNDDLMLGKAYTSVGPITNVGYFVLERLRKVDFQP